MTRTLTGRTTWFNLETCEFQSNAASRASSVDGYAHASAIFSSAAWLGCPWSVRLPACCTAAPLPRRDSPAPSLPAGHRSASTIFPALRAAILDAVLIGRLCSLTQGGVPESLLRLIVRDHISWRAWESCCSSLSRSMGASSPACTSIIGDRPAHISQSAGFDLSSSSLFSFFVVFFFNNPTQPSHTHCFLADPFFAALSSSSQRFPQCCLKHARLSCKISPGVAGFNL